MSENISKENIEEEVPLEKPIKNVIDTLPAVKEVKQKKARTPAQQAQFENARIKRQENIKNKENNKKLEASKLLLENELKQPKKEVPVKSAKEQSDTEDERVVYVKMPKKKTTKKQIIIQDDDTTSSDESETVLVKTTKKPFGKSHRNRNSVVKVHSKEAKEEREVIQPRPFVNYFGD